MKTPLLTLALALLVSTPALAQNEPATWRDWRNCQAIFAAEETIHVDTLVILAKATKRGEWKLDVASCWEIVTTDIGLVHIGEVCNDISNRIPRNAPAKKLITKLNKSQLSVARKFQNQIAFFQPICKKLQAEKEAAQGNEQDEDKMRQESVY